MYDLPIKFLLLSSLALLIHGHGYRDGFHGLPEGKATVKVSLMNPSRLLGLPQSLLVTPNITGTALSNITSYSTLIEHQNANGKETKILFDLGLRADFENLPPAAAASFRGAGGIAVSLGDPPSQLRKYGIMPGAIDTVILSHSHLDHVGNLNLFPKNTTSVLVGPGFEAAYFPGYPTNPNSTLDQTGFDDRKVEEFPAGRDVVTVASLKAIDYFGDGSLYIMSAPGHDYGHLVALARTTRGRSHHEDTFILLAGDSTHHGGAIRPTKAVPLPQNIPRRQHLLDIHPEHSPCEPFYHPASGGFNLNATEMEQTLVSIEELDAHPNVFTVLAHDNWLLDIVDLFPKPANEWHRQGWGNHTRFRFVQDFA